MLSLPLHPTINASLNALAGVFLVCGYVAIKKGQQAVHTRAMIAAFASSALFLASYLYYHATHQVVTKYAGSGFMKGLYLLILIPHSILAVVILPFILMAIWHAYKGQFEKHKAITRKLYPVWLYVSVTGVLVYLMLYVLPTKI